MAVSKMRMFLGRGGKPGQIVVCANEKGYVEYRDAVNVPKIDVVVPDVENYTAPTDYSQQEMQVIINSLASKINAIIDSLNSKPTQK